MMFENLRNKCVCCDEPVSSVEPASSAYIGTEEKWWEIPEPETYASLDLKCDTSEFQSKEVDVVLDGTTIFSYSPYIGYDCKDCCDNSSECSEDAVKETVEEANSRKFFRKH